MSGIISLYQKSGDVVAVRIYDHPKLRKDIIEGWKKLYGEGLRRCYIQVAPDTNDEGIRENGTIKRVFEKVFA